MVNLRPGLDQPLLGPGQLASDALNRIERERGRGALVRGMEVRAMVRRAELREHSDDDSEEARQLRHDAIVACGSVFFVVRLTERRSAASRAGRASGLARALSAARRLQRLVSRASRGLPSLQRSNAFV